MGRKRLGRWILMRSEEGGVEIGKERGIEGIKLCGENPWCFGSRVGRRMHRGWVTGARTMLLLDMNTTHQGRVILVMCYETEAWYRGRKRSLRSRS